MAAKPADTFRRNVGKVLAERGMTMEQLALLCGTKRPNISRILSGKEQVSLERAGRIAKALSIDLPDLISTSFEILQEIS